MNLVQVAAAAIVLALGVLTATAASGALGQLAVTSTTTTEADPPARVELPARRTRSSKTERKADGSERVTVYSGSVHYQDERGDWQPISNEIVPAARLGYAWRNEANRFDALFKPRLESEFLRLEVDGEPLSLTLEEGSPLALAEVDGSRVTYPGVLSGVDLRYDVFSDGVKETLVLADASAQTEYSFRVAPLGGLGLEAERRANGSWEFRRVGEEAVRFVLAAPYASDRLHGSTREGVEAASLNVTKSGSDFVLDLSLDPTWLQAKERKFPVYLDPTITIQPSDLDANFYGDCAGCPGVETQFLGIGGTGFNTQWAAFRFNLSAIPSDAAVLGASLLLYYAEGICLDREQIPSNPCLSHNVDVFRLTVPWSSSSTTGSLATGGSLDTYALPASAGDHWMEWDVKGLVGDWVSGSAANYGVLLRRIPDLIEAGGPYTRSRLEPVSSVRPVLEVDYNRKPSVPVLDSPLGAAAVETITPVLRVNASDPENDLLDNRFEVATDPGFTTIVASSGWMYATNTFTVGPAALKDGLPPYYWRAESRDDYQQSGWTSAGSFTVRLPKLGSREAWPMWSHGPLAVNQATGNLVLSVPGPSYPFAATSMAASASYNTLAPTTLEQGLGPRWTLDTGSGAAPPAKLVDHSVLSGSARIDAIERVSGDGSSDYYTHVGTSNVYLSAPGDGSQLTKNASGGLTLLDDDGAIYTFAAADLNTGEARLLEAQWSETDPGKSALTHCFSGTPVRLTSVRDDPDCQNPAPSRQLSLVWGGMACADALLCAIGPDGVTWKYVGDGPNGTTGKLKKVHDGTRYVAEITYDGSGRPIKLQNANDLAPNDPNISPSYDGNHALTITYEPGGTNRVAAVSEGPVTGQVGGTTSTWSFVYNGPEPTPRTSRPADGYTVLTPPRQQSEPQPQTIKVYYDNRGRAIETVDQLGNITAVAYSDRDQVVWSQDENSNQTDYSYGDLAGNTSPNTWATTVLLSRTDPDPDGAGPLPRPVTRYRYDETAPGTEPALTTSGNEITDAVRSAGASGDGRAAPDSSSGIWEGTTNRAANGGAETNLAGWGFYQATLSRITSRSKFGSAAVRTTVSGGATGYSSDVGSSLSGATAGRTFTGSFWVYAEGAAVGKTLTAIMREDGGATGFQDTLASRTLTAGWQRLTVTRTFVQNDRTLVWLFAWRPSGATAGEYFDIDGAQIEEKLIATPYVETNGAPASRGAANVSGPASTLSSSQGWIAMRTRAGWSTANEPDGGFGTRRWFHWSDGWNRLELYYNEATNKFVASRRRYVGSFQTYEVEWPTAQTFAADDLITLVFAWTGSQIKISLNGGAFAWAPSSPGSIASFPFDVGTGFGYAPSDVNVLWFAAGTGTLSDADASTINKFGEEAPGTWGWPAAAQAQLVWTADTANYQTPTPSAGSTLQGLQASYYSNANLVGRPTARQTDPNVNFINWGTGGPAALGGQDDGFSIRWAGELVVAQPGGAYTFRTEADDGTRLTIDGILAINNWADNPGIVSSAPISLSPGRHKIVLDYYENGGAAAVQLRWQCSCLNGGIEQVVPSSALSPAWANRTSTASPAGRVSFTHIPEPAKPRPDYSLVRQLNGTNVITSFSYDNHGRVTEKVMPKGNANRTIDGAGNLTGNPDVTYATTYAYYAPTDTEFPPSGCGGGPAANQSQLLKSTTPRGIETATFVYDAAGRSVSKTNGVGTTYSCYDVEGRLTQANAPGDPDPTTYTYDPAGAQRSATNREGTVTLDYDEAGRIKRSLDVYQTDARFTYDSEGNLTCRSLLIPAFAGEPECPASVDAYRFTYAYDAEGKLTRVTDPAARQYDFTYDTRDNLKTVQYPTVPATFSWNDYNAAGWLTGLYNRHGTLPTPLPAQVPSDANPLADFAYEYELEGRKTKETRTGGGLATEINSYGYEELGRLDRVTLPAGTVRRYFFDRDSNRTKITENSADVATHAFDPSNPDTEGIDQLTSVTEGGQTLTFTYRPDGEMTCRRATGPSCAGGDAISWDGWGRMTGGTFGTTSLSYRFDPLGRRSLRTALPPSSTTAYRFAGAEQDPVAETDLSSTIELTEVDGPVGDLAHYAGPPTSGSTVTYLYYNGHGDLAATADTSGTRTTAHTYDPFGAPLQAQPANKTVERWTGRWDKQFDTTTSLVEMGVRPYDPAVGRFLAVDPIDGGSLNAYEFAGHDPINTYDLDGRTWLGEYGKATTLFFDLGGTRSTITKPQVPRAPGEVRYKKPPAEHTTGARPSTRSRHEKGQSRQQADKERSEQGKRKKSRKKMKKGRFRDPG